MKKYCNCQLWKNGHCVRSVWHLWLNKTVGWIFNVASIFFVYFLLYPKSCFLCSPCFVYKYFLLYTNPLEIPVFQLYKGNICFPNLFFNCPHSSISLLLYSFNGYQRASDWSELPLWIYYHSFHAQLVSGRPFPTICSFPVCTVILIQGSCINFSVVRPFYVLSLMNGPNRWQHEEPL